MISVVCGGCSQKYKIKRRLAGTDVKCKLCGFMMSIPAVAETPAPPPPPADDSVYSLQRTNDDTQPPTPPPKGDSIYSQRASDDTQSPAAEQSQADDAATTAPIAATSDATESAEDVPPTKTEGDDVGQATDSDITPAIPPPTEHNAVQHDQASEDASQQIPQTPLAKQMQDWQQKAASGIETLSPVVARHASNAKKTAEKAVGQYVSTIKEANANVAGGVPAFVQTAGTVFSIQVIISIVLTYIATLQAASELGGRVLLVVIGVLVLLSPIQYFIGRFFYRIGSRLAEGSRSALWWFVAIVTIRLLLVLPLYAEVAGWFSFLWWLIGLGLDLFLYVPAAVIAVRNKQEFR